MIDDLSRTLRALLSLKHPSPDKEIEDFFDRLKEETPELEKSFREMEKDFSLLSSAVIKFDRPIDNYPGDVSGTVSLFLFDIRENLELRSNEPIIGRSEGRAIVQRPPKRVACSYLVTAWFGGAEKDRALMEQGLLGQALQVLSRFSTLPNELLWGKLKDQQPPLPMMTLMAAEGLKNPAEFWTALGGKLRPSFLVTVTISVPIFKPTEAGRLVTERELRVGERASAKEELLPNTRQVVKQQGPFRIFGRITDPGDAPVRGANVTAKNDEGEVSAMTDNAGRYSLEGLSAGTYTLRAQSGWKESNLLPKEETIKVPDVAEQSFDLKLKAKEPETT
jgi:hypothetical protein